MDYRDLLFYQKAREVVKGIDREIKAWPKMMQTQEIARQLFRAANSVCANIAEGHGRHEGPEYLHYLYVAQGSANEVDHWLNITLDCDVGNALQVQHLIGLNNETRKMLSRTVSTLKRKRYQETA